MPNGIKWADRNVGAETPQDNGAYFSWGSTSGVSISGTDKWIEDDIIRILLSTQQGVPADTITQEMIDNIKLEAGENLKTIIEDYLKQYSLISGTTFDENTYSTTLGGQYTGSTLDAEHDAATVNMGSDWRMPTSVETLELVSNTVHYYIGEDGSIVAGPFDYGTSSSNKGLDGSKLRSICFVKKGEDFDYGNRSNFIEFPFAGRCFRSLLGEEGLSGNVWSSSVDDDDVGVAYGLNLDSSGFVDRGGSGYVNFRLLGFSVRGVRS